MYRITAIPICIPANKNAITAINTPQKDTWCDVEAL